MTTINFNKEKGNYQLSFWHKEKKQRKINKSFIDLKEAENFANDLDFSYYKDRKHLLPKGIIMTAHNKKFGIFLPHQKSGLKQYSQHKILKEALDNRKEIIKFLCLD